LKSAILSLADKTQRGLNETEEQKKEMLVLFEQLEKKSPTKNKATLKDPNVSGNWELKYTTSSSILGRGGFARVGSILQTLDVANLAAANSETVDYILFKLNRKVTAELKPISKSEVAVQFKKFTIGPISFSAPESFKGRLDVTYVDGDLRLSRGDKGNIFVLTRVVE